MSLESLEAEKVALLERLVRIGQEQKAAQREVRRVEREQRAALQEVEEYSIPEGQDLTLEDVEAWCRSAFSIMAHSMPSNPHVYFNKKKVRRPDMYELVVRYVLEHGYEQTYGREVYRCLDVELNGGTWFLWPMTDSPEESVVLNAKPDALRPAGETEPRLIEGGGEGGQP